MKWIEVHTLKWENLPFHSKGLEELISLTCSYHPKKFRFNTIPIKTVIFVLLRILSLRVIIFINVEASSNMQMEYKNQFVTKPMSRHSFFLIYLTLWKIVIHKCEFTNKLTLQFHLPEHFTYWNMCVNMYNCMNMYFSFMHWCRQHIFTVFITYM